MEETKTHRTSQPLSLLSFGWGLVCIFIAISGYSHEMLDSLPKPVLYYLLTLAAVKGIFFLSLGLVLQKESAIVKLLLIPPTIIWIVTSIPLLLFFATDFRPIGSFESWIQIFQIGLYMYFPIGVYEWIAAEEEEVPLWLRQIGRLFLLFLILFGIAYIILPGLWNFFGHEGTAAIKGLITGEYIDPYSKQWTDFWKPYFY